MQRKQLTTNHQLLLEKFGLGQIPKDHLSELFFKKGEYVSIEGQPLEYLLVIKEGKVKVCHTTENGKTLLFAFYTDQGMLGDVELMTGNFQATTSVQAITDFECIGIPLMHYENWLKNSVDFLNCVGNELAEKLDRSGRNSAVIILHPLETRLCTYISIMEENGIFSEKLTVLAELLGTSYRHLLRTLNSLCQEEILKKTKRGYEILSREKLQKRSEDDYLI